MKTRTVTNALGETFERTWTDEDLDALIRRCGLDHVEVPADVAAELARLVRRPAAAPTGTRRGRAVTNAPGPDNTDSDDRPEPGTINADRTPKVSQGGRSVT